MDDLPHFECDGCGACCQSFPVFASVEDARREPRIAREARALPPWQATPEGSFRLFPIASFPACVFLDGAAQCSIYSTRPDICRAFAAGSAQCQDARTRHGLPPLAPGDKPWPMV